MVKWVRSGVLEGAPELVAELGGDYRALARKAGVPLYPMANPDLPVRVDRFTQFMELAAARLGEPAFGLRLGLRQNLALFGPMALLLGNAATVGEMVRDLTKFFPLHTQGSITGLEPLGDSVMLTYELVAESGSQQRQVIELGFGVMLREFRRHFPSWTPPMVTLRHAPPVDRSLHRRLFGEHILFNADRNSILLDPELLARPTPGADPAIHEQLAEQYGAASRTLAGLVCLRTETVVRAILPYAQIDLPVAARLLGHSQRTLQRRLASNGTSFSALYTEVRASLALSYLTESALSVAEIAEILQFSETSALSRFVRQRFGASPREIRKLAH